MKKIKLFHKDWEDLINIDNISKRLSRTNINDEFANYSITNNILFVKWDKWDIEIFITHKNDDNYYYCEEINFYHTDWEDICYIDYKNCIIYRKSNFNKGIFEYNNSEIDIIWEENNNIEIDLNKNNIELDLNDNTQIINKKNNKIPNIIHFVFGLKEQTEEFDLYRYIAIKSAYDVNRPDRIYFYYYYEPYGYWWNKIKPLLVLEKIEPPTEIFENKIYHYAHQADIIRLKKLIERGGIYLDMDTICLRSFSDLLCNDFVMGTQPNSDNTQLYGLCNAIILSSPNSNFGLKWLDSYRTFRSKGRDTYWDEHSVLKPLQLSEIYKNDITVLNSNSFFYPLWYTINDIIFNENVNVDEYKKIISNNYCIHLWDTYSNEYLKKINENYIFNKNTIYNIFSRKFLKNRISLVFLTYNRLETTKRCLDSYIKCLDNDDIAELIVLDNNSDKDTINYLKDFQKSNKKINIIFSDVNLGVCHGRIELFKEAIGDIIISLDSDAYLRDNIFFDKIKAMLYDERYGIIGISGAYIKSWEFGNQEDIDDNDENEYIVDHIAGCCQAFRRDLYNFGFGLDPFYGKFWVEDTDLSMQSLELNKINYRLNQKNYLEHHWGGSGKNFKDLFFENWNYFARKWRGRVLHHLD
jgi:GT2 family glycosyltransferase/mannosyltransferase OCH1-like enzyme